MILHIATPLYSRILTYPFYQLEEIWVSGASYNKVLASTLQTSDPLAPPVPVLCAENNAGSHCLFGSPPMDFLITSCQYPLHTGWLTNSGIGTAWTSRIPPYVSGETPKQMPIIPSSLCRYSAACHARIAWDFIGHRLALWRVEGEHTFPLTPCCCSSHLAARSHIQSRPPTFRILHNLLTCSLLFLLLLS